MFLLLDFFYYVFFVVDLLIFVDWILFLFLFFRLIFGYLLKICVMVFCLVSWGFYGYCWGCGLWCLVILDGGDDVVCCCVVFVYFYVEIGCFGVIVVWFVICWVIVEVEVNVDGCVIWRGGCGDWFWNFGLFLCEIWLVVLGFDWLWGFFVWWVLLWMRVGRNMEFKLELWFF